MLSSEAIPCGRDLIHDGAGSVLRDNKDDNKLLDPICVDNPQPSRSLLMHDLGPFRRHSRPTTGNTLRL